MRLKIFKKFGINGMIFHGANYKLSVWKFTLK